MSRRRQRKLDTTVAAIQKRHGPQAIRRGMAEKQAAAVPHISTGFPALDAITGCKGVPLGTMTLISGRTTSGKLTLGYKALTKAQQHRAGDNVALIDLFHSSDPDYLKRREITEQQLAISRKKRREARTEDDLSDRWYDEYDSPLEAYLAEDYAALHAMECERDSHGSDGYTQ